LEESIGAGGDLPALGRDFDKLAIRIGEVEEDLVGDGAGSAGTDATPNGEALVVVTLAGLGFQVIEDGVEGVGCGDGIVFRKELVEEPVAIRAGANGEDEESAGGWGIEAYEGLAIGGGEGDAAAGDPEEQGDR
jgi:hypothetical protein